MTRNIRRWIFWMVAIPLTIAGLGKLAETLERRRGPDSKAAKATRGARKVAQVVT